MNDRIFSPNRNNVFSAMQHNMESYVKKVNMRILSRCLENPRLLLTFSVFATLVMSHFFFPSKN